MSTALKKITTRAKQIRKKHPGMAWTAAIKKAGVEYRGGKIGKVAKPGSRAKKFKTRYRQTGTANRNSDEQRKARIPGKRKSASGKIYYERRKNRSDKPGQLNGISAGTLKSELIRRKKTELANALLRVETATSRSSWLLAKKAVQIKRAELKKLQ